MTTARSLKQHVNMRNEQRSTYATFRLNVHTNLFIPHEVSRTRAT